MVISINMSDEINQLSPEVIKRLNDEVIAYENFLTEMERCEERKDPAKGTEYLKEITNEKEICDRMKKLIEDNNFVLPRIIETVNNTCRTVESNLTNLKKNMDT